MHPESRLPVLVEKKDAKKTCREEGIRTASLRPPPVSYSTIQKKLETAKQPPFRKIHKRLDIADGVIPQESLQLPLECCPGRVLVQPQVRQANQAL